MGDWEARSAHGYAPRMWHISCYNDNSLGKGSCGATGEAWIECWRIIAEGSFEQEALKGKDAARRVDLLSRMSDHHGMALRIERSWKVWSGVCVSTVNCGRKESYFK